MGAISLDGRTAAAFALAFCAGLAACSGGGSSELPFGGEPDGDSGPGTKDTTPPEILDGLVTTDVAGSATIWWLTDEPSTTSVSWGPTEDLGEIAVGASELVTSHVVELSDLEHGEPYWFRTTSADSAGNEVQSPALSFVQGVTGNDAEAPKIGGVTAVVEGSTATVAWKTDEPATSKVEYGLDASYGAEVAGPVDEYTTDHSIELSGLDEDVFYHYRVVSQDVAGNPGIGPDHTFFTGDEVTGPASVTGERVAWHPLEVDFDGPSASEADPGPNPFLDHRLVVTFRGPSGQSYRVPGFFAGDGDGGGTGDVWRARFSADEGGTWSYEASFHAGPEIAISLGPGEGAPLAPDGETGTFTVAPRDPEAEGFLSKGRLEYVGGHYLKFRDGGHFLKGGTDSPENLLGYRGFDNTFDQPGGASTTGLEDGVHRYATHVDDFVAGDPWFVSEDTNANSKGIVGALNYLSSVHVNSVYFLPMNLGGDGRETYPFVGAVENEFDKTHYDVSKLRQWEQVFAHAQRRGIMLHVVLGETESGNEGWLDGGALGVERKLFYREMIARFAHHPALKWNLSEENDFSQSELTAFAQYIRDLDPYDHPIAFHTHYLPSSSGYGDYEEVLGDPRFSLTSIQGAPEHAGGHVETWRAKSANAGHPWVVDVDELGPAGEGLTDTNVEERRKLALWDVYLSGGNIEWYAGYHSLPLGGDMRLENFRTREEMWNYTWYARRFVEENLPFWEMEPMDGLASGESGAYGGAEVFAKPDEVYAVYYPDAGATGSLDLTGTTGAFLARWYDPRTGEFAGDAQSVPAGGSWEVGGPPSSDAGETVFLEESGLVVVQVESVPPAGSWVEETSIAGYTGASYFRWDGPDHFHDPGHGTLRYPIEISTPGTYQLRIRNRHDDPLPDQENDCWARMDGGTWTKVFSNDGAASVGVWNWLSTFEHGNGVKEAAHYELSAGVHVLEISGRSHGYRMDRFHLYLPSVDDPQSLAHPPSDTTTSPGSSGGAGEDWVLLLTR